MNLAAQIYLYVKNLMGPTLAAAGGKLQGWGSKVGTEFNKLAGKTFGVAQAFTFIKGSMEESLNRAKQFVNLGKRMGMPADEVAKLERYAEMAGVNIHAMNKGFLSLQKFSGGAMSDINGEMGVLSRNLGMNRDQLMKVRAGGMDAFIEVRKQMEKIPSAADRAQYWVKILGDRYSELRDFVDKTPEEMAAISESQIAMGATTIESVGESQKAWGNMFADLSVMIAEGIRDSEPLIGVIRMLLNLLMIVLRTFAAIFGILSTVIQLVFAVVNLLKDGLLGLVTGGFKKKWQSFGENVSKLMSDRASALNDTNKAIYRDVDGAAAGWAQTYGKRINIDMPQKRDVEKVKDDRRTLDDVHQYQKHMKTQEAIDRQREDSLLVDQAKIDNMKKIVEIQEYEAQLIKDKFGTEYKHTKEYMEYLNKRMDKLKEIEKLEYELAQKKYDDAISWIDLANDYYLKEMEITYKSEAEMRDQRAKNATEKIQLMQAELEKMLGSPDRYSGTEIAKHQQAMYKLIQDTSLDLRKPLDPVDYKADSLASVGGGGNVSTSAISIAKAQLMQQQESNRYLRILAEQLAGSGALGAIDAAGVYARNIGGGVRQ
jgi:hypothetical protein